MPDSYSLNVIKKVLYNSFDDHGRGNYVDVCRSFIVKFKKNLDLEINFIPKF